jgi:hypothetical protein
MNISSWLTQTVTVRHATGLGANGNPTFSATSELSARVSRKTKAIVTATGETVEANHHITLLDKLDEEDQLMLPGESSYRRPIRVDEGLDKGGNVTHYEVWL